MRDGESQVGEVSSKGETTLLSPGGVGRSAECIRIFRSLKYSDGALKFFILSTMREPLSATGLHPISLGCWAPLGLVAR